MYLTPQLVPTFLFMKRSKQAADRQCMQDIQSIMEDSSERKIVSARSAPKELVTIFWKAPSEDLIKKQQSLVQEEESVTRYTVELYCKIISLYFEYDEGSCRMIPSVRGENDVVLIVSEKIWHQHEILDQP